MPFATPPVNESDVEMFGEMTARWYQIAAKNQTETALEAGIKRILVVLPTGAGKTLTSGLIFSSERVRRAVGINDGRRLRLLFVAHKQRLLTQAERAYADAANIEFISQSAFSDIPEDLEWDLACIDEAHHEAMSSIQYHLERMGDKPIIGLTATPDRADGMLIKFEEIIHPLSREDAVNEGYLAPTYLNSVIDTPARNKVPALMRLFSEYGHEMEQTMVFVRTIAEVEAVTAYLNEIGYNARSIIRQSDAEVDSLLDDFSAKRFQFVVNCNKINEGVDVKYCSTVVLGRQFGSYPQLNQVIGRAARPDSPCNVWELINPLSGYNLDTTVVVGTPERHRLISTVRGQYEEQQFDYVTKQRVFKSGIAPQWLGSI